MTFESVGHFQRDIEKQAYRSVKHHTSVSFGFVRKRYPLLTVLN